MKPFELRLYRRDLRGSYRSLPLDQIESHHIGLTIRDIYRAHRVVICENDMTTTRVMKDRTTPGMQLETVVRPLMTSYEQVDHYLDILGMHYGS